MFFMSESRIKLVISRRQRRDDIYLKDWRL